MNMAEIVLPRQRGVDKCNHFSNKIWRAAIARPLGISPICHESRPTVRVDIWRDMRDCLVPSSRISSQMQCSCPSQIRRSGSSRREQATEQVERRSPSRFRPVLIPGTALGARFMTESEALLRRPVASFAIRL